MALPNDIGVEPVCTVDDVIPTPVNFGFQLIEWIHARDPLFSPPRCRRTSPTSASNAVSLKQQNGRTSIPLSMHDARHRTINASSPISTYELLLRGKKGIETQREPNGSFHVALLLQVGPVGICEGDRNGYRFVCCW